MTTQEIQFFHRGAVVSVNDAEPTRTVLDWLREDAHCTGTKEGCNEGDCGACTVVIGELAQDGDTSAVGGLKLQTVNACIQFLPTLHGKALFTVEDLKTQCVTGSFPTKSGESAQPPLHPVQQAWLETGAMRSFRDDAGAQFRGRKRRQRSLELSDGRAHGTQDHRLTAGRR